MNRLNDRKIEKEWIKKEKKKNDRGGKIRKLTKWKRKKREEWKHGKEWIKK